MLRAGQSAGFRTRLSSPPAARPPSDAAIRGRRKGECAAVLFTETEIETRVNAIAHAIARAAAPPEIIVPVLVGAFVFAADLARALVARRPRPAGRIPLAAQAMARTRGAGEMRVRVAPGEAVRGKHVLLVDGVLDHGTTL